MESCPPPTTSPLGLGDPHCNFFMKRGQREGLDARKGKTTHRMFCSKQCAPREDEVSRAVWEERVDDPADTVNSIPGKSVLGAPPSKLSSYVSLRRNSTPALVTTTPLPSSTMTIHRPLSPASDGGG